MTMKNLKDLVNSALQGEEFDFSVEELQILPEELDRMIAVLEKAKPIVNKSFNERREKSVPIINKAIAENEEVLKAIKEAGFSTFEEFMKFQISTKPIVNARKTKGVISNDDDNTKFAATFEIKPGVLKTYVVSNFVLAQKVLNSDAYNKHLTEQKGNNKFTYLYANSGDFRNYCKHEYKDWVFWLSPGMGGDVNQMGKPAFEQWLTDQREALHGMSKSEIKQKFYTDTLKN